MFVCVLFVCWFVGPDDNSKSMISITIKFSGVHMTVLEESPIDFGDDPDIQLDIHFFNFLNICPTTKIKISLERS